MEASCPIGTTHIKKGSQSLLIDLARGFAMFLMLWGHCIQYCCVGSFDYFENTAFKFIYSFHMPLFMLVSGYLFYYSFEKRSLRELLIYKTQAMLQPIIMCAILAFFLTDAIAAVYQKDFMAIVGSGWLNHLMDYWFLWSVLAASVYVAIVCKLVKHWLAKLILLGLGIFFVALFPSAQMSMYMYPYFVAGFYYAELKDSAFVKKMQMLKYLPLVAFPIMLFFFGKEHYIYTSGIIGSGGLSYHLRIDVFRWFIGLMGSVFALVVLEKIVLLTTRKGNRPMLLQGVVLLGRKSMQVYVLSCIFLTCYLPLVYRWIVDKLGTNVLTHNMGLYTFLYTVILAIAYCVGMVALAKLLEKTRVSKLLFGR